VRGLRGSGGGFYSRGGARYCSRAAASPNQCARAGVTGQRRDDLGLLASSCVGVVAERAGVVDR
jgi:hypothetical protein